MEEGRELKAAKTAEMIVNFLIDIPVFDALRGDELRLITRYMNLLDAKEGEVIFRQGDRGDYVCFIAEGDLDVLKETSTGNPALLSTLRSGRSIGEMAVIDDSPRSATAMARGSATLITLSKNGFDEILDDHPSIGIKILKGITRLLSQNLRKTSSRLADYLLPLG